MDVLIDTSVKGCNVALFDDSGIIASVQEPIERGHAEAILPIFETLMADHGKTPSDIQNIYTTIGPGSFTGLRVGVTVAQFMGFSLQKPVHGITSFQAFSSAIDGTQNRIILIETKRSDFYVQILGEDHNPLSEAQSLDAQSILPMINENMIVTGDAVERFVTETGYDGDKSAQDMVDIHRVVDVVSQSQLSLSSAEAFYVREADVSQPKNKMIRT